GSRRIDRAHARRRLPLPSWKRWRLSRGPLSDAHRASELPGGPRRRCRRSPSWRQDWSRRCSNFRQRLIRRNRGRRCGGDWRVTRVLFFFLAGLFFAAKAVVHAADVTSAQVVPQVWVVAMHSAAGLKIAWLPAWIVDAMKIVADCVEKVAANSVVDRELGAEL